MIDNMPRLKEAAMRISHPGFNALPTIFRPVPRSLLGKFTASYIK
jgi:hypothetical protein